MTLSCLSDFLVMQLFEVSDVVLLDSSVDVGASNQRHICALFCDQTSGFEVSVVDDVGGFLLMRCLAVQCLGV